jgi:hypothetical protein
MKVTDRMVTAAITAYHDEHHTEYPEIRHDMRQAIEAAMQAAWISVDNYLPTLRKEVIVKTVSGRITSDVLRKYDDGSFGFEYHYGDGLHDYTVTHWMPLQEYKGE